MNNNISERQLSVGRRGKLTKIAIYAGVVIILLLLPLLIKSHYWLHLFLLTFTFIICVSSLRFISLSGQLSLGHAAFMGIGAYSTALLSKYLGWIPWITIPLAALATAAIAMIVGYPFTRLRALYFAIITLVFGLGVIYATSIFPEITGGYVGMSGIPQLFGFSKVPYYYFFLLLTIFSLLIMYRLEFSRFGVTLKAIDQSYLVASSVGINEAWYRILAMTVGCFFAGLAGACYVHYTGILSQGNFSFMVSLNFVIYMFIGGAGSFAGPMIGTAVLLFIPEIFKWLKEYAPYISAGMLVLVIYIMPQGLVGLPGQIISWLVKRRKGRGAIHAS